MKYISLLTYLFLIIYLCSCNQGPIKVVWLDELGSDSCYVQDWGRLEVNRSVVHTPLTVNSFISTEIKPSNIPMNKRHLRAKREIPLESFKV